MHNDTRFEIMKNDLCRAAVTIHKLKQERNEYKVSYELLNDEIMHKRENIERSLHLEDLRDANEHLQKELKRFKKIILEKDRTIMNLNHKIEKLNKNFKSHLET